jgi:hypothetical protein
MSDIQVPAVNPPSEAPKTEEATKPVGPSKWLRLKGFVAAHRTRSIIAAGVFLIVPTAVWAYVEYTKPVKVVSKESAVPKKHLPPKPTTKPSPLTGAELAPDVADRPILSVVIENHPDARPQSGLGAAGVVYEALAEGGITRFQAFFLENKPPSIGPVRSLRTYFVDWALEFAAPVAHAGGNADALDLVSPLGMKDINGLCCGSTQYFFRTKDRFAPHNFYTTGDLMNKALSDKGWSGPATFKPSPRKKDEPTANPQHPVINIDYSYNGFQVQYKYDQSCDCYARFIAGAPHLDRNDGQQIHVKNVVVEYMPTSYGTTRIGEQTVMMGTPGSGRAIVFRDGGAVEGTWTKASHTDRTKLLDANGKEIPLDVGNTWYSIVPTTKTVSF